MIYCSKFALDDFDFHLFIILINAYIKFLNLKLLIILMQGIRIKLNQPKNSNSLSRSKINSNHSSNKKNIQNVRDMIDKNLKKTYQKLRLDVRLTQKCNESDQKRQQSSIVAQKNNKQMTSNEINKHIIIKRRNNFSANGQYYTPFIKQSKDNYFDKDQIVLVNNRDVMEYIQLVYQTYNIKDPLKNQDKLDDAESTEGTVSKNRLDYKNCDESQSLNSARTTKLYAENVAEISEFDIGQQVTMKKTTNKKNSKLLITLRSKTVNKKYTNQQVLKKLNPLFGIHDKNCDQKAQNDTLRNQAASERQLYEDNMTFRYCFACEMPIFEKNIKKHQSFCHELQLAYSLSFSKIIDILDAKIERLATQIKRQVVSVQANKLSQRFQSIQASIMSLIEHIPNNSQQKAVQSIQKYSFQEFKRQQAAMKHQLSNIFYESLEKVDKLSWFVRLRANVRKILNLF